MARKSKTKTPVWIKATANKARKSLSAWGRRTKRWARKLPKRVLAMIGRSR